MTDTACAAAPALTIQLILPCNASSVPTAGYKPLQRGLGSRALAGASENTAAARRPATWARRLGVARGAAEAAAGAAASAAEGRACKGAAIAAEARAEAAEARRAAAEAAAREAEAQLARALGHLRALHGGNGA
jgi:hypothetical protein